MKNILLPTDFSENSWNAIKYAINFFEKIPCNFYLLHVDRVSYMLNEDMPYASNESVMEDVYTKPAKTKLRHILKRISEQFVDNKNHRFYTLTDYNFFIESIRRCVEEKKIDCIVMGTKGASGLSQHIIGTNTGDVITKVKCTTLSVPENAEYTKIKEIAFPTDFSLLYDIQILQPLSEIIEQKEASLRILHTSKKETDLNSEQYKNKELLEDYFGNYNFSFHFLTNKKLEDALQYFVGLKKINMICMIAKNLNYFQQILFHSKVEEISYHIEVPFLVLHE